MTQTQKIGVNSEMRVTERRKTVFMTLNQMSMWELGILCTVGVTKFIYIFLVDNKPYRVPALLGCMELVGCCCCGGRGRIVRLNM